MSAVRDYASTFLLGGGLLLCTSLYSSTPRSDDLSLVEIPVSVTLDSIREELEQAVPLQRYQKTWQRHKGIDVRYRIWRGPLTIGVARDRLHLSADVGYWISARKKLLGPLKMSGDCGLREPPRVARLHLSSRLFWGSDWRLNTDTRIHQNLFANPCRLTRARLDVTPVIDRYLNRKMNSLLRQQVDLLVPRLSDMRDLATSIWQAIRSPMPLEKDVWLVLNPVAVSAAPFHADTHSLNTAIGITMQPKVVLGPRPKISTTRLPNIEPRDSTTKPGLDFVISVDLPLENLRDRFVNAAGQRLTLLGMPKLNSGNARLHVDQGDLILEMPSLSLRTRPILDKERQRITLSSLLLGRNTIGSTSTSDDTHDVQIQVTGLLEEALSWSYEDRVESIRRQLDSAVNRSIHPRLHMSGHIDAIEPLGFEMMANRIQAKVRVAGSIRLLVE